MNTCRSCKYYDSEKLWCNKWNNEKYTFNQIQKGCFAFELKKRLSKESKEEEIKKEERRIKRLKKQGIIPLSYDEWRKKTNQPFMTGLGNEDGYDEYLEEFYGGV